MDQSDRFVFINGPSLGSAGTINDRRWIRSQLMRRIYQERLPPEERSQEQLNPHVDQSIDKFAASMRGHHHQLALSHRSKATMRSGQAQLLNSTKSGLASSSNADRSCCAFCSALISAGHETGTSTVCNHCGKPAEMAVNARHNSVIQKTKRNINRIVQLHLTRLADAEIDSFGGPANGRGHPGYYKLLDHFFTTLVPSLRRTHAWIEGCFEAYLKGTWSPLLFHSTCMAPSVHLERTAQNNGAINYPSRATEQLYHKGAALRALRSAITGPIIGTRTLDEICDYNPFNPPLQDLQGLDSYGFSSFHGVHWNAITQLVMRNGGLNTVKLYGAPWFLSYTSLKYTMFTASTPEFPIIDPTGNMYGSDSPFQILQISVRPWHKTLCSGGFRQLQTLRIKKSVVSTLLDLSEFAQAVQLHLHLPRQDDAMAIDRLGDVRNLVQHRLLCLPKPSDQVFLEGIFENKNNDGHERVEEDKQQTAMATTMELYRACWLAAFLFSTHVTFPISATRPTRENLVPQLQDAIRRSSDSLADENEDEEKAKSEIVLWCTMIGGIAAQDGELERRCWYAGQLRKLCHILNIQSWAEMQKLMRSFAWVDVACDEGDYGLWMEAYPFSRPCR
ncbi:uncharacterized protein P174DRAFT_419858 [Aspergillus novofumigatus IBT 16806]|uniref:Uncharacterized protein n=1 Tax=Aspergillus novofumigatus (strain IBT 16806) TaxID=1392255 RepID=A0A2I1CEC7_ASPN1|nr:uncharacterized protein P174DRAFT_419858 [Aspergillus novofumigatus IBT 16806]PKX95963.1 hypothetical protein P174DRAFT_419858 [Aspergillus novofumigatus IBT 16806]